MASDYPRTIMRQYANSPTLLALLEDFDQWVDAGSYTDGFLADVWDITTAVSFGLDIWGRILGRSRNIVIQQAIGDNFGFDIGSASGTNWQPWDQAPWYNNASAGNVSYALGDDAYRRLLLVKAAANIAAADCPSINALMRAMFGSRGRSYVTYDLAQPMVVEYHFEFVPTTVERTIIESGLFPQPAGTTAVFTYNT